MRTKAFLLNTITTGIMQLVMMIVGFIVPRVMLKEYGSEVNGLVSSISQFIAYFNLVEAGLAGASVYSLYKPIAESNYKAINAIVSATKRLYTQSGYIFISLVLGLAIIYPYFIETTSLSAVEVSALVLILGANGALEFFTLAKYRVLLTADQKVYIISIATIASQIINMIIVVTLASLKVNIVTLRTVALFSIFIRSTILMLYTKKKYRFLNYRETPDNKAIEKRWDALYLQIMGTIHVGAPIVIATVFTSLKEVSVYSIYQMVLGGISGIVGIFANGLSSSFGNIIVKGENETLKRAYSEFEFFYYTIITIIYSVTFVTIMQFISIYTNGISDINYNIPIIGFLSTLNGLLHNIKTPQGMIVFSAGLFKETRIQTTIQGAIVVVLGCILVPYLGLSGILIASITSNIYRDIDLIYYIPKSVTKLPIKNTVNRILRICISCILIYMPMIFIKIKTESYLEWINFAIITLLYSIIIVIIMGLIFEKNEIKNILNRLKKIFGIRR